MRLWFIKFSVPSHANEFKQTQKEKPTTPYEHEGYKTTLYYSSNFVRCDDDVWANDVNIQLGVHFIMSRYANWSAMMISPCILQRLIEKGRNSQKRITRTL